MSVAYFSPRFEVPKPKAGLDFFIDNACGPIEFTLGPLAGPGESMPEATFSCSLLMKICVTGEETLTIQQLELSTHATGFTAGASHPMPMQQAHLADGIPVAGANLGAW